MWKPGPLNPHTGRDFVQFVKTESVLNKGAKKIALLFNPPPVLSFKIMFMIDQTKVPIAKLHIMDIPDMPGIVADQGHITGIRHNHRKILSVD